MSNTVNGAKIDQTKQIIERDHYKWSKLSFRSGLWHQRLFPRM